MQNETRPGGWDTGARVLDGSDSRQNIPLPRLPQRLARAGADLALGCQRLRYAAPSETSAGLALIFRARLTPEERLMLAVTAVEALDARDREWLTWKLGGLPPLLDGVAA